MHPASRRQIVQMLETFSLAPEVTAFDLGCLDHATGRMSFRKTWTAPEVRRALGWLAARNATGSSCYIRPAAALGRTRWVLAGPLTDAARNRLPATPGLDVESSPGVFEAWLRLAAPADPATRTAVARFFTRKAGGDPRAVRGAQLGHLPGTTNRAPAAAGPASFVVLRSRWPAAVTAIPRELARSAGLRSGGGGEPAWYRDEPAWYRDEPGPDQSRRDFAIACRLLEAGSDDRGDPRGRARLRPAVRGRLHPADDPGGAAAHPEQGSVKNVDDRLVGNR